MERSESLNGGAEGANLLCYLELWEAMWPLDHCLLSTRLLGLIAILLGVQSRLLSLGGL
jgi:hypothetical protein